jgi:hypothetical protein
MTTVTDAVVAYIDGRRQDGWQGFDRFIIAEPDPLVEALSEIDHAAMAPNECANELRATLAARGLEIREIAK